MTYKLPGRHRRLFRLFKLDLTKSIVCLLLLVCIFQLIDSPAGEYLDNLQLRIFFNLRGKIAAPKGIIIAAIDDNSFYEEKISSLQAWPRQLMTEAIINIKNSGAKLIVIDLLFDPNTRVENVDENLIQAISDIPTSIAVFESFKNTADIASNAKLEPYTKNPREEFIKAAKFITPMMVSVDPLDGIVKKFYYSIRYIKEGKSPIPLAEVAEFFLSKKLNELPSPHDYINYYGPSGSIKTISINKLLDRNISNEIKTHLKDKIVVIGTFRETKVESKSEDQFNTVFDHTFGAEIHATSIANLIYNNWITKQSFYLQMITLSFLTIITTFRSNSSGPFKGSLIAIFSALALSVISYQFFLREYFIPCLIYSIFVVPLLIIGNLAYHYYVTLTAFRNVEEALGVTLRPKK